jgi:hypothetical protein
MDREREIEKERDSEIWEQARQTNLQDIIIQKRLCFKNLTIDLNWEFLLYNYLPISMLHTAFIQCSFAERKD